MVAANAGWAVLGHVVRIAAELLVGILIGRYLGPEQYGLMNYVISFVTLLSVLSVFGLDSIETCELSRKKVAKDVLLGTAFRLRIIFGSVTMMAIAGAVCVFEGNGSVRAMILTYSLSIIVNSTWVIRSYYTSIVQNAPVVKAEIVRTVLGSGIKVLLLLVHAPLSWFVAAVTFDFLLLAGGYVNAYKTGVGSIRNWTYDATVARRLVRLSFPVLLSNATAIVYQRIDQVMIRNMLDDASLGIFSTAVKVADLAVFLPFVLSQTIAPILTRVRESDPDRYQHKKQQFVGTLVWVAFPISVLMSATSYWLIYATFGRLYLAAAPVLQILAFKAVGMALAYSSVQLIVLEDLQRWAVIRNVMGCGLCVAMNLVLIPRFGIMGSAWASLIVAAFTGCLANVLIPPYHGILKLQMNALFFGWKELLRLKDARM
jgi:O-antigen/teichoic acid export membrane protein